MAKWIEVAHDKNVYLFPTAIYWLSVQQSFHRLDLPLGEIGCWYKDDEFSYLVREGAFIDAGREIIKRLKEDHSLRCTNC